MPSRQHLKTLIRQMSNGIFETRAAMNMRNARDPLSLCRNRFIERFWHQARLHNGCTDFSYVDVRACTHTFVDLSGAPHCVCVCALASGFGEHGNLLLL